MKKLMMIICLSLFSVASANTVSINGYNFELDQFNGATVTYRADGSVTFDGKYWDNNNGVDLYTLGELAAGQYGADPGDQISLNDRNTPDWLQLNYGTPVQISSAMHVVVIYEISSYQYVDPEGTSFQIKFNNGSLIPAQQGVATSYLNIFSPGEDTNQIVFDLYDFGFSNGDLLSSIYIENVNSGSGTSDPDFIFAGVSTVPEPATLVLLGLGGLLVRKFRKA
jgi:hypothetical protein